MTSNKLWSPDGALHLVWGKETILDPDGSIAWEGEWTPNALLDEGEQSVLNVYLLEAANPTKYLALLTAAPGETATMATMTEVFAPPLNGYSRVQVLNTDWGAPGLDSGDYKTTAAEKTFGPASSNPWNSMTNIALVTTSTGTAGKLLLTVALSGTTTVNIGQSFKYTLATKAQ
jgi:hypothetical protein